MDIGSNTKGIALSLADLEVSKTNLLHANFLGSSELTKLACSPQNDLVLGRNCC